MPSTRKFSELREQLEKRPDHAEKTAAADARLQAFLDAHRQGLADIRKARHLTQIDLATQLGISQPEVSRVERQADLFVSTLRSYVHGLGGELHLVVTFNDGVEIPLELAAAAPTTAPAGAPEPAPARKKGKATSRSAATGQLAGGKAKGGATTRQARAAR